PRIADHCRCPVATPQNGPPPRGFWGAPRSLVVEKQLAPLRSQAVRASQPSALRVIDRVLAPHADALFDTALAVTGDSDLAVEAVREAGTAAADAPGPD